MHYHIIFLFTFLFLSISLFIHIYFLVLFLSVLLQQDNMCNIFNTIYLLYRLANYIFYMDYIDSGICIVVFHLSLFSTTQNIWSHFRAKMVTILTCSIVPCVPTPNWPSLAYVVDGLGSLSACVSGMLGGAQGLACTPDFYLSLELTPIPMDAIGSRHVQAFFLLLF